MTFISYAQNFEDVILWRALREVENGFYIDVGACSPDDDSVTHAFYERGWRGINVEPNPIWAAALSEKRPEDENLFIALGDEPGSLNFYVVLDDPGISTANPSYAELHRKAGYQVRAETFAVLTLDLVWERHVLDREVHFLKIDVEGFEEQILLGNDWSRHRPWIVLVEATFPYTQIPTHEAWDSILIDAGYDFVYADGLNRFYLVEEHSDLRPAFAFPPNFFDQFKTAAQAKAEARAAEVDQALSAEKEERERADALATAAQAKAEARVAEVDQALSAEKEERERADALATAAQAEAEARAAEVEQVLSAEKQERERADAFAKELEENRQQLDQLRQRAAELQSQVLAMHYSKSWRITAPLRAVVRWARTAKNSIARLLSALVVALLRPLQQRRAARDMVRLLMRHARLRRLGARVLEGRPEIKAKLLGIAWAATSSSFPTSTAERLPSITGAHDVVERLPETARAIYAALRDLYRARGT